jgi:hypothetical protein
MMLMTWPVRKVAPKQGLLPHRFNYAKFKSANYIYIPSKFPATKLIITVYKTSK